MLMLVSGTNEPMVHRDNWQPPKIFYTVCNLLLHMKLAKFCTTQQGQSRIFMLNWCLVDFCITETGLFPESIRVLCANSAVNLSERKGKCNKYSVEKVLCTPNLYRRPLPASAGGNR